MIVGFRGRQVEFSAIPASKRGGLMKLLGAPSVNCEKEAGEILRADGLHYKNTCAVHQSLEDLACHQSHVAARHPAHRSIRLIGTL
jgi:hypothetical protein